MKLPSLCKQKRLTGDLAYVRINGTKIYRGPWGSSEASEKYERILTEWLTTKQVTSTQRKDVITVRVLVAAFLDHAETYYVKNGYQTKSYSGFIESIRVLLSLYGTLPVDEFGPVALETVQKKMIHSRVSANGMPSDKPLACKTVNRRIQNICQIFAWGVGKEMVKPETHYALTKLPSLKIGRTRAIELPSIKPVDDEVVEKTIPFLPSPVAAMVRLQRLTAMRPGEVRAMRACDIDTTPCVQEIGNRIGSRHRWREGDFSA